MPRRLAAIRSWRTTNDHARAINEKGGSGRTTAFVNLAAGLAARGRQVLLVDADEQGHATLAFGFEKYAGLYDLMVRGQPWKDVMVPVEADRYGSAGLSNLYLLGSNVETHSIALNITDAWTLANRLEDLRSMFDFCLIDTSPTPSLLHSTIFLAADYIVCPTELEVLGIDGLHESIARPCRARHSRQGPAPGGNHPQQVPARHVGTQRTSRSPGAVRERRLAADSALDHLAGGDGVLPTGYRARAQSRRGVSGMEMVDRVEALENGK